MENREKFEKILGMEISQHTTPAGWNAIWARLEELDPSTPLRNNFLEWKQFRKTSAEYKKFCEEVETPIGARYAVWGKARKLNKYFYDPVRAEIEKINFIKKLIPLVRAWDGKVYNRRFYAAIKAETGAVGEDREVLWWSTTLNRQAHLSVTLWNYGEDYITQEAHHQARINAEIIIAHLQREIEISVNCAQRKIDTLKNVSKIEKASKEVEKIVATLHDYDLDAAGELVEVLYLLKRFA